MLSTDLINAKQLRIHRIFLYVALFAFCNACALSEPRRLNYQIIHEPALQSEMRSMGVSIGALAEYFFEKNIDQEQLYKGVHAELNKLERTASRLGGVDTITNYSVINRYMGAFLYDVRLAREFAEREPPNFEPAFRLIRSCQSCHESM